MTEPGIPPPEDYSEKEMYAFFGLASYHAQVLEHGALNLAVGLRLPGMELVTQELFEDVFSALSKKTFGQLLKAAKTKITISEEVERTLNEALDTRNNLIHHYFREHAEDIASETGRKIVIKELSAIIVQLKKADNIIEDLYMPLWEQYGVNDDYIEKELTEMKQRARERDAAI